eukprot:CAMPEP_0201619786 /NCGR_PEP_ID=MMETSP0492-20130828/42461_1 /ASSEMBLY_ACC=CAM_ASM_000837 /TAXON_ID=420259 /ORGANISM="Thalassiosira gravida, Strain GMp14c1" /LENGTH=140 /DNA_ID=CAMNT_0048088771 /DNA_START=403 /DNA_END=825 /DNA_ORIENTATION=-
MLQLANRLHILLLQLEPIHIQILLHVFRIARSGNDRTSLLNRPSEHDLRNAPVVLLRESSQYFVPHGLIFVGNVPAQREVRRDGNVVFVAVFERFGDVFRHEWVVFDLIIRDGSSHVFEFSQMINAEVGDARVPNDALFP